MKAFIGFALLAVVAMLPRTADPLFTADQSRLYQAVPHRGNQRAEIRVYDIH